MSTNLNQPNQCPSCGRPMPVGALAGLCPACLLAQGAETEPADTKARVRFEPPKLAEISRLFPQLQVLELLGAGGMGAVYKARQPALDRLVALKVLPAGGGIGSTERFNREARALARLSHPNIVGVHEFGQVEGLHFFIMEFVDGANLRQLEKIARLSAREALQIIPQICDALQYAHDEGVVHRDIKPENVLVDRKGRVKIADFGLAKIADPDPAAARLTVEGQVMGTPHYMAPEQVERPLAVDHRADIYALGVVFYEMLTGDLPLGKFAPPSRKVQLDVRLDDIVLRALENDPERRYQQASEVKQSVATVVDSPERTDAGSQASAADAERRLRWLNIPVVVERKGVRAVDFQGAMLAIFVVMMFAAAAHMFVRWAAGREHALSSLVVLAGTVVVVLGIRQAMTRSWSTDRGVAIRRFAMDASSLVGLVAFIIGSHYGMVNWVDARRAARGEKSAQVAKAAPASGTLAVTLANGTMIELLGLANGNGAPNQWWRPDGTPMPEALLEIQGPAEMLGNDRPRTKLAFKVTGSSRAMETATYEFEPSASISAGGEVWQNGEKVAGGWPMVAAWANATNQATLRFGLRFDNWRNIAVFTPDKPARTETSTMSGDPKWIANLNHYSDDGSNTLVTAVLNRESRHWRMRLVAVDKDGQEHFYHRANVTPSETTETWTCTFPNLTVNRIDQFQVQVQPVHWVEFRDVPLQPAKALPEARQASGLTRVVDQAAQTDPRTGAWFAELPGGGKVELLAIGEPDAAPNGWWTPDGAPMMNTKIAVTDAGSVFAPAGRPWDLIFRLSDLPAGTQWFNFDFVNHFNMGGGGEVLQNEQLIPGGMLARVAWPPDAKQATARVAFGLGEWQKISTHFPPGRSASWNRQRGLPDLGYVLHDLVDTGDGARATFALGEPTGDWRTRLIAVDADGREHPATGSSGTRTKDSNLVSHTFAGVKAADVRQIQVQVQPIHWVAFRNFALVPLRPEPLLVMTRFGEFKELTVEELLDLDTMRTGTFPVTTRANPGTGASGNPLAGIGENIAWMQEQGFDVEARHGTIGLLGVKIVYLSAADWESLTPTDLRHQLGELGTMPTELRPPDATLPITVGFRTREEGEGLFQIVRFADAQSATTLRLKHAEVFEVGPHAVNRRALDASWEELGNSLDLSSPERAVASFGISLLESPDPTATVAATTIGLPRLQPGSVVFALTSSQAAALRSRRIVSVATYREHLACVIVTGPPGETATCVSLIAGWRDGQWRLIPSMSLGLTPSVVAAQNRFANAASVLWSRFEATPTAAPVPAKLDPGIAGEQTADLLRATVTQLANAGISESGKRR